MRLAASSTSVSLLIQSEVCCVGVAYTLRYCSLVVSSPAYKIGHSLLSLDLKNGSHFGYEAMGTLRPKSVLVVCCGFLAKWLRFWVRVRVRVRG